MPESTEQLSAPKVYSVYELTASVRRMLENSLGAVCVEGEISGYRMQPSVLLPRHVLLLLPFWRLVPFWQHLP